jgi:hypothetical protein
MEPNFKSTNKNPTNKNPTNKNPTMDNILELNKSIRAMNSSYLHTIKDTHSKLHLIDTEIQTKLSNIVQQTDNMRSLVNIPYYSQKN